MDLSTLSDNERLIAEQALLAYRSVREAVKTAPHGRGMDRIEQAVRDKGFDLLRRMVEVGASEHPEAQKGGPRARCAVAAGG
jgi:hypothetical protein